MQTEKAGRTLIRPSGMKFETKAKYVEMPASWATSLHNTIWWTPSKSPLTMPTVTRDATHCCCYFTDTSLQSVFDSTNSLQFSVYFKVFTKWILKFHSQAVSCMWHSMQDISYFTTLLCDYNKTNIQTNITALQLWSVPLTLHKEITHNSAAQTQCSTSVTMLI